MWKGEITQEDLIRLDKKITDEQTQYRHELKNSIQKIHFKVDEIEKESIKSNIKIENMAKDISEIKATIKEWFEDIKQELKTGYTPISEHKHNSDRIWKIEKVMYWIAGILWTWILWALLTLIFKEWLK